LVDPGRQATVTETETDATKDDESTAARAVIVETNGRVVCFDPKLAFSWLASAAADVCRGLGCAAKPKAPEKAPPPADGSSFNQLLGIRGAKQETVSPPPPGNITLLFLVETILSPLIIV
jgi:hypothetical protein